MPPVAKSAFRWAAIVEDIRTLLHNPAYQRLVQKLTEVCTAHMPHLKGNVSEKGNKALKLAA